MAKVADIFVGISGSAASLISAVQKGAASLKTFQKSAKRVGVVLAGLGGTAAVGILAMAKAGLQAVDDTNKLARDIGITSERFAELSYAASLSGISVETLGTSLQKLGVNLSNADDETSKALQSIGLNINQIRQGDVGQAFDKIVSGLEKIDSPAEKAAIAMKLFGKSGLQVIDLLIEGSASIADMSAKARDLGLAFNSVQGDQVEKANDAIDGMGLAITGLSQRLAIEWAPAIQGIAEATTVWLSGTRAGVSELIPTFESIVFVVETVTDAAALLFRCFAVGWAVVNGAAALYIKYMSLVATAISKVTGLGGDLAMILSDVSKDMMANSKKGVDHWFSELPSETIEKQMKAIRDSIAQTSGKAKVMGPAIGNSISPAMQKATIDAIALIDTMKKQSATMGMSSHEADVYKMKLDGVSTAVIAEAQAWAKALDQQEKYWEKVKQYQQDGLRMVEELKTSTPYAKYIDDLKKLGAAHKAGLIDFAQGSAAAHKLGKDLRDSMNITSPFEKAKEEIIELQKLLKAGIIKPEEFNKAISQIGRDLKGSFQSPLDHAREEYQKLLELYQHGMVTTDEFKKHVGNISEGLAPNGHQQHATAALKGSQESRDILLRNRTKNVSTEQKQLKAAMDAAISLKNIERNIKPQQTYVTQDNI